ncbi:MAG: DUF4962 domain-containing protein [Candidatus Hydrogenedentes bacterium]|nr:DUF4962 domain-containing protein [Candidatus Hydrogenedentota bacterium]
MMGSMGLAALLCLVSAFELNDAPAVPGEWGFRPGPEHPAASNPPAFVWRPQKEAARYELQVAGDTTFDQLVYETESALSSHCPPQTLPAGAYAWRYRALNAAGEASGWSQARPFTIATDLPAFPKPPLEELLSRMPTAHPRVFFRPEEVAMLKEKASGPLAEEWQALVAEADRLLASPPPTAEPPLYPEGTKVKGELWKKIWWGNRVYSIAVADGAATLAFVYQLTGDRRYGEAARELMVAFADWDPKGSTNYRYNDEAAMPLLKYPARAYSWAYDLFTPEERKKIQGVMAVRGGDCYRHLQQRQHLWDPYASHSNRAWHFLGEVAIAFHGEIPEADEWLEYAMTIFYTCYPVWGGADGGWHEGTGYWSSYLGRFLFWGLASQAAFNIDPFDRPFFSQTGYFGLYTMPPGNMTGAWGDQGESTKSKALAVFMRNLGLAAGNPHWVWYADVQDTPPAPGYVGFILAARAGALQGEAPVDLPPSRVFPDTGIAVLNTDLLNAKNNIQVHFKSSPYGRQSHGYNANNAFLLNVGGERVFIKSGQREIHGSPHHTKWMWETKSDNAILVNGKGQRVHDADSQGKITHWELTPEYDIVEGEAGAAYEHLKRWTRRLIFLKPDVLVIHDILEAPEPSTFQWLLHAQGKFELGEGEIRYSKNEQTAIRVAFLTPSGLDFSQTDQFDPPPHDWAGLDLGEWHFQAATRELAETAEFVTVITNVKDGVRAVLQEESGEKVLVLEDAARKARITLSDREARVDF